MTQGPIRRVQFVGFPVSSWRQPWWARVWLRTDATTRAETPPLLTMATTEAMKRSIVPIEYWKNSCSRYAWSHDCIATSHSVGLCVCARWVGLTVSGQLMQLILPCSLKRCSSSSTSTTTRNHSATSSKNMNAAHLGQPWVQWTHRMETSSATWRESASLRR